MREMKDSGVEWIGEIPVEWNLIPAKRVFHSDKRVVGNAVNEYERLALTMSGVIKRSKEDNEGLQPDKFEGYQILRENELVFKLIDLENVKTSRVGLSPYTGLVSPAYIVLSNDSDDNKFYFYWYMSLYYNEVFNRLGGNGVRSALNAKDILSLPIPDICEPIRKCIAAYLNLKCAKIDAIIARQQQVIEKLKAYKLSVITEAVTKGLNPDVPMQDSGIEWMGSIPIHWTVRKVLWDYTVDLGKMLDAKRITGSYLHPYIRNADVQWDGINCTDLPQMDFCEDELVRYSVLPGDLMVCEGGDIGKCFLIPDDFPYGVCYQKALHRVRTRTQANGDLRFLRYILFATSKNGCLLDSPEKATIAHLPAEKFNQLRIPTPPLGEMVQVCDYLDKKCKRIESETLKRQLLINKLAAYKKSLIYEVVTGKREITADTTSVTFLHPVLIENLPYAKALLETRVVEGLGKQNKGHIQVQKCLFFIEQFLGVRFTTQYIRHKQGPYDWELPEIEKIMATHEWVYARKQSRKKYAKVVYTFGKKLDDYRADYQRLFGGYDDKIQQIIDFVKPIKHTSEIGRMATLFAAWNDFILDGISNPTDEQIISEVRSNWTDNKANTPVETWQDSLNKLRAAGMVPHGYGRHTVKLEEGDRNRG